MVLQGEGGKPAALRTRQGHKREGERSTTHHHAFDWRQSGWGRPGLCPPTHVECKTRTEAWTSTLCRRTRLHTPSRRALRPQCPHLMHTQHTSERESEREREKRHKDKEEDKETTTKRTKPTKNFNTKRRGYAPFGGFGFNAVKNSDRNTATCSGGLEKRTPQPPSSPPALPPPHTRSEPPHPAAPHKSLTEKSGIHCRHTQYRRTNRGQRPHGD